MRTNSDKILLQYTKVTLCTYVHLLTYTMAHRRPATETLTLLKVAARIFTGSIHSPSGVVYAILNATDKEETISNREKMKRKLQTMRRQGYLSKYGEHYALSKIGLHTLEKESLWTLSIPTPKKHDGFWRLLVFDIPKEKSRVRIVFVRHLQNLGLQFYQRSVWIYPYSFEREVRQVAKEYGLLPHISFITATQIDKKAELCKKFRV